MLKYIKDEKKLFGKLRNEEQKNLLLKIFEWVEVTFDNGNLYSTDFFGYGSMERQRRFISAYTEYKDYFLFQLHYIDPEEVEKAGLDYSYNNNGKYVDIRSYSVKTEQDIEKLKDLIHIAYNCVPLEVKGISDEKLNFAKRLCDAYETTKLDGNEIQVFGSKISISTSDEIILGDNLPVKLGTGPDRTEKVKYKFLKLKADTGTELDLAISWGERNKGYPYHLIVFINNKPVIECYIPKWVNKKTKEHFSITIPNTFNRNEGNQEFKQIMQKYLESTENNTGVVLDEGKIKIGDFPEELDWDTACDNHIRMLLVASLLRAEIRGICNLKCNINQLEGEEDKFMPTTNLKKMQDITTKGFGDFINFVKNKKFSFGNELRFGEILTNYIFSLKTKPFVILSGISGTGKTKIAQFFAEFMCPDEEVEEIEMNREDESIYKVPNYFIKYSRIVLKNSIAELIRTPITEKSTEIGVSFDGLEGKCWFGYANNQNRAKQILFRGEIARYVKNNIKIDDYLRIYVNSEDEVETIVFEKINPEKKRVIQKSNRYAFISVRPDWTDNRSLLGYYNPITECYQPTEFLKLMLRAREDKENPYFVIFDEMNLAKVEYYFSDFLSCMESRRLDGNGGITSEKIILHDAEAELPYVDDDGTEYKIPKRIEIPLNIYFTGTVNVDETTYMFSPKVLDRSNVIEFNEVDMESYKGIILEGSKIADVSEIHGAGKDFINYFIDNGRYCSRLIEKSFSKGLGPYYDKLMELNIILKDYHMHFGYRVIDEIMMYLSYSYEYYDMLMEIDLDVQILQKVLPKLNGNKKQLEMPLTRLLRYCFNVRSDDSERMLSMEEKRIAFGFDYDSLMVNQYERKEKLELIEKQGEQICEGMEPLFPRSAKKLCRMISMLDRQGYASFIE